jgi:hypothetical protein
MRDEPAHENEAVILSAAKNPRICSASLAYTLANPSSQLSLSNVVSYA